MVSNHTHNRAIGGHVEQNFFDECPYERDPGIYAASTQQNDRSGIAMKMRKKSDLPTKVCAACGLPFAWRKKWERDWDSVKFCSERCRRQGVQSS
jgi:hypothetical protein